MQRPLQAVKTSGERERVEALLRFYRPRQRVRLGRGDFYVGKSCFPEKESFPCDFCLCCVAARTKIGESGVGFCGFARAKLPQLKLKFETRRPAGEMHPRPPACQEYFFGSLKRPVMRRPLLSCAVLRPGKKHLRFPHAAPARIYPEDCSRGGRSMKRAKKRQAKTAPTDAAMALTDLQETKTDPLSSYTGVGSHPHEKPVQDADDL